MPTSVNLKEYKQLLLGKKQESSLISLISRVIRKKESFSSKRCSLCKLNREKHSCPHWKQIANSAAIASNSKLPFPQLGEFKIARLVGDEFKFKKALTRGGYGQVFLVEHRGREMVAKVLSIAEAIQKGDAIEAFLRERTSLLQITDHSHVLQLYYSFRSEYFLFQMMEYICGGDLSTWREGRSVVSEGAIKIILVQLILGLKELTKHSICHGDLKLENVLISAEGNLKLADFGLSHLSNSLLPPVKASKGTPDYMAPEQLTSNEKTPKSDIWSLGICAWELLTGLPPFYDANPQRILESICAWRGVDENDSRLTEASPVFKKLLSLMLLPNPDARPDISTLMQHEFFANINWRHPPSLSTKELFEQSNPELDPFEQRNHRFADFKAYNLRTLQTEKIISPSEHSQQQAMFPDTRQYQLAAQLYPLCNLKAAP